MELQIQNGDYVPDGLGGFRRLTGGEALLQRVLFRLREKPAARQALAEQYVAEALAGESGLRVTEVSLAQEGDRGLLTVRLDWQGEALAVQTLL